MKAIFVAFLDLLSLHFPNLKILRTRHSLYPNTSEGPSLYFSGLHAEKLQFS